MRAFLIMASFFILSSFKGLKKTYDYSNPVDHYFLTFTSKHNFELEFYSCTYSFRVIGNYKVTKDSVYLDYRKIQTKENKENKWVDEDTSIAEVKENMLFEMQLANRYKTLIRKGDLLIPADRNKRFKPCKNNQQ
jgi:hypothetical protein